MSLLEINDLSVRYRVGDAAVHAVEDAALTIEDGETCGLVGESGCGKTTLGKAVLHLLDDNGYIESGEVGLDAVLPEWAGPDGRPRREVIDDPAYPVREDGMMNLVELTPPQIRRVRWKTVSIVPQSAMNALNPVYRVGDQITEAIHLHEPGTTEAAARETAAELLEQVGIDRDRMDDYAHEFSGGMRQRAVIAMAMACDPDLVIADEPTTALDVIIQDRVLDAIDALQEEFGVAMLIISHDISVMAETCDRLAVMYGGRIIESGTTEEIFREPAHPYTLGLQNSFPTIEERQERLLSIPGTPPTLLDPDDECRFVDRCPFAVEECYTSHPPRFDVEAAQQRDRWSSTGGTGHRSACYRLDELDMMRDAATEEATWE